MATGAEVSTRKRHAQRTEYVSFTLEPRFKVALEKEAKRLSRPVSTLIRTLLVEFLIESGNVTSAEANEILLGTKE